MKKLISLLFIVGTSVYSNAQTLPKASPEAEVEQTIGATKIELEYSRPGVKNRAIFGGLIPYSSMWRFGANSATTISTEHSLFFKGKELKKGTYSMFAIPEKEGWKIIFNKDEKATVDSYDENKTALIVSGNVTENSFTETLFIGFDNLKEESASLIVLWDKTKVEVPFTIDTKINAKHNIEKAIKKGENLNKVYNNAANYYYGSTDDKKLALEFVNKSIKIEENYRNLFMKARIIYDMGEKKEAVILAEKALKLSESASKGYQGFISGTISKWTK